MAAPTAIVNYENRHYLLIFVCLA